MSYIMSLDEYDISVLRKELLRREILTKANKCDYCERLYNTVPSCRFPERHNKPIIDYEKEYEDQLQRDYDRDHPGPYCMCGKCRYGY
jgi:hypothetical protein